MKLDKLWFGSESRRKKILDAAHWWDNASFRQTYGVLSRRERLEMMKNMHELSDSEVRKAVYLGDRQHRGWTGLTKLDGKKKWARRKDLEHRFQGRVWTLGTTTVFIDKPYDKFKWRVVKMEDDRVTFDKEFPTFPKALDTAKALMRKYGSWRQ